MSTDAVSGFPDDPLPPGDTGDADEPEPLPEPKAFRVNELALRDPHMFFRVGFFRACTDITDQGDDSINNFLLRGVRGDADEDGLLDSSLILSLQPLSNADDAPAALELFYGDCTAPLDKAVCRRRTAGESVFTGAATRADAVCGAPVENSLSGYQPALRISTGPCFEASETALAVDVIGGKIPLESVVVTATYGGTEELVSGVLRGFISESRAREVILTKDDTSARLASLLPGGEDACPQSDDRDLHSDGAVRGWYIYFNFSATRVPLAD